MKDKKVFDIMERTGGKKDGKQERDRAAALIIRIPVPKTKEDAMEIPKYLLKIMSKKV